MHICSLLFLLCIAFFIRIQCVILSPHTKPKWNFTAVENENIDALIRELSDLPTFKLKSPKFCHSCPKKGPKSQVDTLKRFCLEQQALFLKELVLPCIKGLKSLHSRSKSVDGKEHTSTSNKVWDYKVSDEFNRLKCSVLSNVPSGTILIRPINSKCEYISLPVLNSLYRSRPNIIKILYPKHDIRDLNELYRYASFETMFISQLCSNDRLRRLIVTLSLLYGINIGKDVIIDLFLLLIRSKFFWNRTVYSYWSRSLSLPLPLLLVTANNILNEFLRIVSSIDDKLKESLISVEGALLNRDLRNKFKVVYVKDSQGNILVHKNYFD
ncbi:hypothetical protein MACJ_002847 [Theileria orientalis]|uniref:Uncharacterized protein n=1 Tax=Theileria orientalis TaxID=68886 RepID=A0A976QSZ9_THEOR|nr:hypothetical protein MACJ_002847 [Theileria orientalis]